MELKDKLLASFMAFEEKIDTILNFMSWEVTP